MVFSMDSLALDAAGANSRHQTVFELTDAAPLTWVWLKVLGGLGDDFHHRLTGHLHFLHTHPGFTIIGKVVQTRGDLNTETQASLVC